MNNIKLIGTGKSFPIHTRLGGNFQYNNVVNKAFTKYLSSDKIHKITTGYRRSEYTEERLNEDYLRGDIPYHKVIKDEHYYKALNVTNRLFSPKEKIKVVHYTDLRLYPWTLPTSVEAPFSESEFYKKVVDLKYNLGINTDTRMTFHNLYNEVFVANRTNIHRIKEGETKDIYGNDLKYWNTAHARAHLVKEDDPDKIRMVFGVPKLLLQAEMMFLWPIFNHLLNLEEHSPMLWGFETFKGGWYKLRNFFSKHHPLMKTILSLDWRQFDKRARFEVIDDIHDMWHSWFDFEHGYWPTYQYPNTETDPKRIENLWQWMCNAIKHTPDKLPNGNMYQRQHAGIASGFLQTQLLDSCYNMVMVLTVLSRMGFDIDKIAIKVQGDDSLVSLLTTIPSIVHQPFLDTFAQYAEEYFGAILHTKKSKVHSSFEDVHVLGFKNRNGHPYRDPEELLASLLYPERATDLTRLMARAIGIAYANCGTNKSVYAVCEDIFQYLESEGFTPNPTGLPDMIKYMYIDRDIPSQLQLVNQFPSFFDTFKDLTNTDFRNESQKERFWPKEHFIY
uniref:Putative RNA-dependent RNA polymerase n=1 Tax=Lichen partiti-like RNA virus sp. TaxID=2726938 RepID=A0A6J4CV43_9VIRU|nr:putative RNA-dependent RNA polymerase [Lichen partiti-like RNA virus sp.]